MDDVSKVEFISIVLIIPVLVSFVWFIATSYRITSYSYPNYIVVGIFFLSCFLALVLFLRSKRINHYYTALREFQNKYVYEEAAE